MGRRAPLLVAAVTTLAILPVSAAHSAGEVTEARDRANDAADRLADAKADLTRLETEIDELEEQRAETEDRLERMAAEMERLAVDEFVRGRAAGPVVETDDLNRMARAEALARAVTGDVQSTVEEYRAASEDLASTEERLKAAKAAASAAVAELEVEQRAARVELERLAASARARSSRVTGGRVVVLGGDGDWSCPVQGPTSFTNDWGMPRSGGRRHQGNDILSPRGTPVVASVSGTVRSHNSRLGGLSYYLTGDDGNVYFGTHLDSVTGVSGRVEQGTVIGYVGDSGNARGGPTHLHFEIHPGGGSPVNPYPTVAANC